MSKNSTGRVGQTDCPVWPNYKCYTPKNVHSGEALAFMLTLTSSRVQKYWERPKRIGNGIPLKTTDSVGKNRLLFWSKSIGNFQKESGMGFRSKQRIQSGKTVFCFGISRYFWTLLDIEFIEVAFLYSTSPKQNQIKHFVKGIYLFLLQ